MRDVGRQHAIADRGDVADDIIAIQCEDDISAALQHAQMGFRLRRIRPANEKSAAQVVGA